MKPRDLISEFLSVKRFAMAGVSRDRSEFSRKLFREFRDRGYDIIPVNPGADEIDGIRCLAHVRDINPPVTAALLMTSPSATEDILRECADGGVTLVWIYGISGEKEISPAARKICQECGIELVPGYCPYMFMPMTAFFHRIHGFAQRLLGSYPV